jgi:hypothetical protein
MNRIFWLRQFPLVLLALATVVTVTAWQGKPAQSTQTKTDSIPDKNKKVRDIDEALQELEKGRIEVEKSIKEIDFKNIDKEIREAMKGLELDTEKMKADIAAAMKEVDMTKIQADIQKAMKEIDMTKIKSEIDASISKIDFDKMKADIEKVKTEDLKKMQEELKNIRPDIEKSLADARVSIDAAKKDMLAYKGFIDGLDKDGMISKKGNYTIEWKKGELTINGQKQPDSVISKYKEFLKDRKDFKIKRDEDDFDINND